jgi:Methylase of chemotaxis methyl-accepting proteins
MDHAPAPDDRLNTEDFERFNAFIEDYCGVPVPREMKVLVEMELRRRARAQGLPGIHEYCRRLTEASDSAEWEKEIVDLIDRITNTHTLVWSHPGD